MQSKVRKPTRTVEADTLREKECGEMPRFVREAFLLWGEIFWDAVLDQAYCGRLASRWWLGPRCRRACLPRIRRSRNRLRPVKRRMRAKLRTSLPRKWWLMKRDD